MGNVSGRENGSGGVGVGGGGGRGVEEEIRARSSNGEPENHALQPRVPPSSDLIMLNSPPRSPRHSRSPFSFSPQPPVPIVPIPGDGPSFFNQIRRSETQGTSNQPLNHGIPMLITWSYGGNNVAVEGSWDNWTSRRMLQRSGKDHTILLVLPSGIHRYKFIVDGNVRYIPDLPYEADEMGNVVNLLDVHDYVPENFEGVAEFEAPSSPESSYNQDLLQDEDYAKDPMLVPPQLHLTVLGKEYGNEASSSSAKPQHVVLNHLFVERGWAPQSVVALGLSQRYQSKYVTVVLYKPLKR